MLNRLMLTGCVALVVLAMSAGSAQGWIVTQTEPSTGAGLAEAIVVPFDINTGVDLIEIHKFFMVQDQAIVLSFVREEGDNDIIQIVDEMILNMCVADELNWDDYHVMLINDPTITEGAEFIDPFGARAWQQTGGATRLGGSPSSADALRIDWQTSDMSQAVPYGSFVAAPTNQLVLRGLSIDVSGLATDEGFQLKQWPTVPEPATLTLLAGAGLSVLYRRRRSRR